MRFWTIVGCVALFLPNALLDLLGWDMFARQGPAWVKFHPATYLFAVAAILPMAAQRPAMLQLFRLPRFRFYAAAAILLSIWSIVMTGGASGGGEMSAAIVTFVTPALMLVSLTALAPADAHGLRRFVHTLLIVNSAIGVVEYAAGIRLFAGPEQYSFENRSFGLFGHPLASAGMCGLMLVRSIVATNDDRPPLARIAETALHAVALLTFGGRAALICVPIAAMLTILVARPRRGDRRIGLMQRLGVVVVLILGGLLLTLPIDLAQAIVGRFGQDAGSGSTRLAAFSILSSLSWNAFLFGANEGVREFFRVAFNTETAVEVAWINLVLSYGAIATAMISAALITLFFRMTRDTDASGWGMTVYFFLVQSTSIGFGSKTVVIAQVLLIILVFCRTPRALPQRRDAGDALPHLTGLTLDTVR